MEPYTRGKQIVVFCNRLLLLLTLSVPPLLSGTTTFAGLVVVATETGLPSVDETTIGGTNSASVATAAAGAEGIVVIVVASLGDTIVRMIKHQYANIQNEGEVNWVLI
jgi:hypothetical protein